MYQLITKADAKANKQKFYFTGIVCKNGHTAKRFILNGNCHDCFKATQVRAHAKHYLRRKYGITPEQFEEMLAAQNNLCAICQKEEITIDGQTKELKKMSVDHCHTTGKIRGLLCNNCNQGIGKFKDNPEIMLKAVAYLEKHK